MPDRDKVIKGIQCRLELKCNECPYTSDDDVCDDCDSMFRDALELLKEQEVLLKRAYELLADMDLDFFCDDLVCNDGWCDDHCTTNGTTPECIKRWLRKQIEERM